MTLSTAATVLYKIKTLIIVIFKSETSLDNTAINFQLLKLKNKVTNDKKLTTLTLPLLVGWQKSVQLFFP